MKRLISTLNLSKEDWLRYKVSWVSSESKRVDSQRLKKEQPDIFNRYSKNVSSRRFTIIHAA